MISSLQYSWKRKPNIWYQRVRNIHPEIAKMLIDKFDNPNPEVAGMYLFYPYAASGGRNLLSKETE